MSAAAGNFRLGDFARFRMTGYAAMALSQTASRLLATVVDYGGYGVYAENIPEAAELLLAGYVRAEDDYEGPRLYPTDKGRKAAKKRESKSEDRALLE